MALEEEFGQRRRLLRGSEHGSARAERVRGSHDLARAVVHRRVAHVPGVQLAAGELVQDESPILARRMPVAAGGADVAVLVVRVLPAAHALIENALKMDGPEP